ncbi:MAG: Xaa-Pro aminopeptidase [Gammaproteobacteria bacterium RIFCSPHIGHO2_12_FULL_37_14]|nr:MAG: Xaa-Pro aminopeptidase [Gammaproteobacteria bacterium RIFCSPHIGHO2_12_FULL_37_14]
MISMTEYAKRRKNLLRQVGPTSIIILPAAIELIRNGDTHYSFRQQSDFYYLTGFDEPEAVLVLAPKRKEGEYILFNRIRHREHEIWDGPRAGQKGACQDFLADQAFPIQQLETMLPELLVGREAVHYPLGMHPSFDEIVWRAVNKIRGLIRSGTQSPISFIDVTPSVHEMRLFKSSAELAAIQQAVDITVTAHSRAMQVCQPGMIEYQLEAELFYEFYRHGSRFPAYSPIVGAGKNSCILHYIRNNQKMKSGDLVLIDAGAEYQNYAADITRTFPVNGRFSAEQRAIYEIVLASQVAAIQTIKPGASWTAAQDTIVKVITKGLINLGILKGKLTDLIEKQAYLPFYMHRSGHWLGLDVHDVGRYKIKNKWRTLEAGMVLTVEPGIYIAPDSKGVHKRWHHIGIRIEDDIVVTAKGCHVLSHQLPRKIDDIEALMRG